jgi:glutathione S-transferase/RNA polymerase-associated protein
MRVVIDVPMSPYAQKVKLALLEKGLAFEAKRVDLSREGETLRDVSPRLEVPVLLDGEVSIFDSSIILEYLDEQYPETPLLPRSAVERARVRMIEELCDTLYDAVNWGVAELTFFNRATGPLKDSMLANGRRHVEALNARLERALEGREWINGEQFGYGDIAAYPYVNAAASQGNKPAADGKLSDWLKRMRGRPSAQRIKQDVLESLAQFSDIPKRVAAGEARRQYRDHRLEWMLKTGGLDIVLDGMRANNLQFSREL